MEDIPLQMKIILDNFNKIRGRPVTTADGPFWDAVVLTASDETQAAAFQLQLDDKLDRGLLPTGLPYLVYADPPGTRAGCGGSTMHVLARLEERFGRQLLAKWRVLLLNAGGRSERLPSASLLGKIFTALPIARFQMLDLKLALYLPFLARMSPGLFHPASDCIEVFAMDPEDEWNFTEPGITALAHPSPLQTGTGHGVYVLEKQKENVLQRKTEFRKCLKVLQKPSLQLMRDEGAVMTDAQEKEFVFTDSLFFLDHEVCLKLAAFYRDNAPLGCEIDSYGDFLQPLGPRATIDYTLNTANVTKVEDGLVETRQKVFRLLQGTPLQIVGLNASRFYHCGTFDECIFYFTQDETIKAQLGLLRVVNSRFTGSRDIDGQDRAGGEPVCKMFKGSQDGCILHSMLPKNSIIPANTIVEYCHFTVPLKLGSNCIISNCQYLSGALLVIAMPNNSFVHTAAIRDGGHKTRYVTVVFSLTDNLKRRLLLQEASKLQYLGRPLGEVATKLQLDIDRQLFPEKRTGDECSLWEAKLFPTEATMSASLQLSLLMVSLIGRKGDLTLAGKCLVSMADIMRNKDVASMLTFRNKLCHEIISDEELP